jgi:protein-tyrosine phosphatase
MKLVPTCQLAQPQVDRLARFSSDISVDLHCHCLPGIDDGPATMADSLSLCLQLVADGITTVIATPHQLGGYEGSNSAAVIRDLVGQLQALLDTDQVPLAVLPGADVRVDLRLIDLLNDGDVLTLAEGPYVLLEIPHEAMIDLRRPIDLLTQKGIRTIVSHPERHDAIARKPAIVLPWLDAGALLQVTAGSLLGQFGPTAKKTGWQLIENGLVSIIASDAHNTTDRPPSLTPAIAAIAMRMGHAATRRMCLENPAKVARGVSVAPVSTAGRTARSAGRGWRS